MVSSITTLLVGIICIVLGISNMRGNISSLHAYHRHRVSEEDVLPLGKKVGLGTIILGAGVVVFGILSAVTFYTANDLFIFIGSAIMIVCIIVGLILSLSAIIKYNKGLF